MADSSPNAASSLAPPPLEPSRDGRPAPLSRMQQRLVFIQQLAPDQPLYQIPTAFRVQGRLDFDLLVRALRDVISRHDILRTVVRMDAGVLTQELRSPADPQIERVDLRGHPASQRERALRAWLEAAGNRPIDIFAGPLIRFALLDLADDDHVFFFMPHHLVWDGASLEIFLRELNASYTAIQRGEPANHRALPIQYGDFAKWHEAYLQLPLMDAQKEYWRERLGGELAPLDLPTDHPRPQRPSYGGAKVWWSLTQDEVDALTAVGRAQSATLFVVLQAAYAVLLHRYTGQTKVLIGTPVRGRLWARTQRLIGMFVNTIIIRADVDGRSTFREVLGGVRDSCREALEHQDMPLDVLVRELRVPRDTSRAPIAQTLFVFRDERDVEPTLFGLPAKEIALYTDFETQDITFWATQTADGVTGAVTYATDLWDAETIARMVSHFRMLLREIASNSEGAVGSIGLVPEEERARILDFHGARIDLSGGTRAHDLIAEVAAATPNAVAVISGSDRLTYGALATESNRLARKLRALGVSRDSPVGLCVERSPRMLIAMLAIFKAGGGYVPLDPAYPKERLAFMAADSEMSVLVTERAHIEAVRGTTVTTLVLDEASADLVGGDVDGEATSMAGDATPESLAYMIYTSGSTGTPKGVMVPHRAVVNFLRSMAERPGFRAVDRLLAVTTLSFDISVLELLLPLSVGGAVVLATATQASDGRALLDLVRDHGATVLQATPTTWRLLLAAGARFPAGFKALCGGEALPKSLAEELLGAGADLWNMYGPTETTVWSTLHHVEPPVQRILIGRPIANTSVYIVDPVGALAPVGVVGEIVIGGQGVARGYLKRPELSDRNFVVDPFCGEPGARMYRTGDLGRYLPDGTIECLGRRHDAQVKIRGYRIELGEIEYAIAKHPSVAQAVVNVHELQPGALVLVAYVVAAAGGEIVATELRKHLRAWLPSFMVPQFYVELPAFPLTPSGKVDKRRLPAPATGLASGNVHVEPRTQGEKLVADLCAELLRQPRVSMADNFFSIGGDSLLSLQLVARIERATGVSVSPRSLIVDTLGQVAALVSQAEPTTRASGVERSGGEDHGGRLMGKLRKILGR